MLGIKHAAIQKDLNRLKEWAKRNFLKFRRSVISGRGTAMPWESSPCCSSSQSVPVASCHVTGHYWTDWLCPFCTLSSAVHRLWWDPPETPLVKSPSSLVPSSWEVLQSPHYLCPFSELSQAFPCLLYTEEPRTGHSPAGVASPVQSRGAGPPPSICRLHFAKCSWGSWAFSAARAHSLLKFNHLSSRTPGPFLPSCFPAGWPPAHIYMRLHLSRSRTWHFLFNFMQFLLRSFWMAVWSFEMPVTHPSSVSPASLLRVHSAPACRSLLEVLNKAGPSCWNAPPVTGFQIDFVPLATALRGPFSAHLPRHIQLT